MTRLAVLGEVAAWAGDRPVDLGPARQRCVLAALAVEAGRVVSVDRLIERVWGPRPPLRARKTLSSYLSRLRRALAPLAVVQVRQRSGGYLLVADEAVVDLSRFRRLCRRARDRAVAGDDPGAARLYVEALGLWRGEPLTGVHGEWAMAERDRLIRERLAAEHDLIDTRLRLGHGGDLVVELAERSAEHPLDERVAAQYMLALHRAGRAADALLHYRQLRQRLVEELGTDPGTDLQRLYRQVLSDDDVLATPRQPFPAAPRQLPTAPLPFTGRHEELAVLDHGMISAVTGQGGVGKTWLALHWAHRELHRFPDGQLYADLRGFDPIAEPAQPAVVLLGFLAALGVQAGDVPADLDARAALYRSLTADRSLLVVLDNARDTAQVRPLLPGTRGCRVLVTSRDDLTGLDVAHHADRVVLDCLDEPTAHHMLTDHLGAGRVTAEPEAVAALLDSCAGLPLALAVVASRAGRHPGFPLAHLADELAEETARLGALDGGSPHTDLRAVLAASVRGLPAEAVRALGLLGHVTGHDVDLDAAARLLDRATNDTRSLLRQLEAGSLVRQHLPGRYVMHDLVRLYARTLRPDSADAVDRLLDFYLATAEQEVGPHGYEYTPWLETEYDNLAASGDFAVRHGRHHHAWRLAKALRYFRYTRGHTTDWIEHLHEVLASVRRARVPEAETEVLKVLGMAHVWQGRTREGIELLHQVLDLCTRRGDRDGVGATLNNLGVAHADLRHHAVARAFYERAVDVAVDLDLPSRQAGTLANMALVVARQGQLEAAEELCERALALVGDEPLPAARSVSAAAHGNLGIVHRMAGRPDLAADALRKALPLVRQAGDRLNECLFLNELGETERVRGDLPEAVTTFRQALDLATTMNHPFETARAHAGLANCAPVIPQHDSAKHHARAHAILAGLDMLDVDVFDRP